MKAADFRLTDSDFGTYGVDLARPECVWIDHDGIWVSDARGGVSRVDPDGPPRRLGDGIAETNGFSRRRDGSFVAAGLEDGAAHIIAPDGTVRRLFSEVDGKPAGTVNCAFVDNADRIWISVMTRCRPWHQVLSQPIRDGYIVRLDHENAEPVVVADGLDLTNELKVTPDGACLYAAESLAARILRWPIHPDGSLGARETVGPDSLGHGAYPDGFAFDPFGNLWVALVARNGLMVIDRSGAAHMVYDNPVPAAVDAMVDMVDHRNGSVALFAACAAARGALRLPTSLAFGGADGRTAYVGSLAMPHLATFRLPADLR